TYTVVGWPSKPRDCCANGKPTSTDESMSGASTSGCRIPATYSHMPPLPLTPVIQIRWPGNTRSMPSSCAADAPSTQTGSRAVPALRNSPCATLVPAVAGRPRVEALTLSALVFTAGISGDRYTFTSVDPVDCTW